MDIQILITLAGLLVAMHIQQVLMRQISGSLGINGLKLLLWPGVWLHEASHSVMGLMFGHRIQKFNSLIQDNNGQLGYVVHTYNARSLWALIGNLPIGLAPMLVGMLIFSLLFNIDYYKPSESIVSAVLAVYELSTADVIHWYQSQSIWVAIGYSYLTLLVCTTLLPSFQDLKNTPLACLVFAVLVLILYNIWPNAVSEFGYTALYLTQMFILYSIVLSSLLTCIFYLYRLLPRKRQQHFNL